MCAELGETYDEVSIDEDPALRERFTEEIPVTFVDGRQHDFWRVDEQRLRAALHRLSARLSRPPGAWPISHVVAPGPRRPVSFCSPVHKLLQ